jgi:hypothetical protein
MMMMSLFCNQQRWSYYFRIPWFSCCHDGNRRIHQQQEKKSDVSNYLPLGRAIEGEKGEEAQNNEPS